MLCAVALKDLVHPLGESDDFASGPGSHVCPPEGITKRGLFVLVRLDSADEIDHLGIPPGRRMMSHKMNDALWRSDGFQVAGTVNGMESKPGQVGRIADVV